MITYPISSNFCKKVYLQCYQLYNLPSFLCLLLFKLFLFQQRSEIKKSKYPNGAQNLLFCSSIDLFDVNNVKTSKEIWKMVI